MFASHWRQKKILLKRNTLVVAPQDVGLAILILYIFKSLIFVFIKLYIYYTVTGTDLFKRLMRFLAREIGDVRSPYGMGVQC